MITVKGVYTSADIYAVENEGVSIDDYALAQIKRKRSKNRRIGYTLK